MACRQPSPWFTTFAGAYKHAAEHGNKPPYDLPESWMTRKSKLKLSTPLNFVSTPDIIGGNSGSPVANRAGEVVGIIFDGNIQSLAWNFMYSDKQARSVSVDSRGIIEALRDVYGADRLVDELQSTKATKRWLCKLSRMFSMSPLATASLARFLNEESVAK